MSESKPKWELSEYDAIQQLRRFENCALDGLTRSDLLRILEAQQAIIRRIPGRPKWGDIVLK